MISAQSTVAVLVALSALSVRAQDAPAPAPAPALVSPQAPSAALAATSARPRIAVVGFVASGVSADVVASLEGSCANEVSRLVTADVISAEDLRMLMNVSAYQSALGCEEGACLQSLGNALAVQQVISGSVRKAGAGYALQLVRLDTVNARVLHRTSVEVAEASALLKAVRQATPALFGVIGKLEIWGQPEGAELFLDGARVGQTPIPVIDVRTPGKHVVEIVGPTVTPWRAEVEIGGGDVAKLRAKNRPIADVESESALWTWGGASLIAGGAGAGAGAGLLYFLAVRNDQRITDRSLRTSSQAELNEITDLTLGYTIGATAFGVLGVAAIGGGAAALVLNPARGELEAALE